MLNARAAPGYGAVPSENREQKQKQKKKREEKTRKKRGQRPNAPMHAPM
jgi:hypothetical protein